MLIHRLPVLLVSLLLSMMFVMHQTGIVIKFFFDGQGFVSIALFVIGFWIVAVGGYSFRKVNTTVNSLEPDKASSLVTTGIYQYSRNPMYIGFLLWVASGGCYSGNLLNLLYLPLFIFLANRLYIQREESALEQLFGSEYVAYRHRVRRWL